MHFYSATNAVRDYTISNVTVDKPIVVHGSSVTNVTFINNNFHSRLMLGNGRTIEDTRQIVVRNNLFDGIDTGIKSVDCSDLEITGNTFRIKEYLTSQANVFLQRNANEKRTVIDGNRYTDGWFVIEDKYNVPFKDWQVFGFDVNGEYFEG